MDFSIAVKEYGSFFLYFDEGTSLNLTRPLIDILISVKNKIFHAIWLLAPLSRYHMSFSSFLFSYLLWITFSSFKNIFSWSIFNVNNHGSWSSTSSYFSFRSGHWYVKWPNLSHLQHWTFDLSFFFILGLLDSSFVKGVDQIWFLLEHENSLQWWVFIRIEYSLVWKAYSLH